MQFHEILKPKSSAKIKHFLVRLGVASMFCLFYQMILSKAPCMPLRPAQMDARASMADVSEVPFI